MWRGCPQTVHPRNMCSIVPYWAGYPPACAGLVRTLSESDKPISSWNFKDSVIWGTHIIFSNEFSSSCEGHLLQLGCSPCASDSSLLISETNVEFSSSFSSIPFPFSPVGPAQLRGGCAVRYQLIIKCQELCPANMPKNIEQLLTACHTFKEPCWVLA